MTATSLTIATWNILGRQNHRTRSTAAPGEVEAVLREHPVDVLCLQEVHFYDRSADEQLLRELAAAGLPHFVGLPLSDSHLDDDARLGVGVASRLPLRRHDTFVLTNPGIRASVRGREWILHDKGMVGCTLDAPDGQRLLVYSLHLFPYFEFGVAEDDVRVDQMWSEFWDYADRRGEELELVLAGDFNHRTREHAAARWSRRKWQFCLPDEGTTVSGLPLDDFALSWSPAHKEHRSVPTFSDHHLVVVRLQFD
ncbi:endonuclease/exonuclease/phosphatase family protein [Actinoplanes sp. NPDC024001]|uniref:endonuclease/exonuclease/phosphatase family protein n=1 Tax=Actinoplanes sp. NPDC024001 TaxID=3154598 RepID=UPI00340C9019